jgi:hypothetical protein
VLARRLHRRDGAVLCAGTLDDLLGTPRLFLADVKMIADEMQERLCAREVSRQTQRMSVTAGIDLFDKMQSARMSPGGLAIGVPVAWSDDQTGFFDPGADDLFDENLQGGFRNSIAIDERLQGQGTLVDAGRRDDGFAKVHGAAS